MCSPSDAAQHVSISLRAWLSPTGQRDALRRGVDPAPEVIHTVTPDHPLWERVVDLDPPLYSDDIVLDVNRPPEFYIENREPEALLDFDDDTPWWPPEIKIRWGAQEPLDEWPTLERMVEIAELHRCSVKYAAERAADEVDEILPAWEAWTSTFLDRRQKEYSEFIDDPDITEEIRERRRRIPELFKFRLHMESFNSIPDNPDVAEGAIRAGVKCKERIEQVYRTRDQANKKKALVAEATAWIDQFGSSRLRKALAAGLIEVSLGAYRDERLAQEHPGWAWYASDIAESTKPINNPSETALDVLLEARGWNPHAELRWWPGEDGVGYPIVVASFLDRGIYVACIPPYDVF